jgi:hypothetical protein
LGSKNNRMSTKKLHHFQKEVKELKLKIWLQHHMQKMGFTKSKLSQILGMNKTYLSTLATKDDFTGAQLVALGNYLDTDPFEPYRPLLNNRARITKIELQQAQKIAELEEKISALEKELVWFKEVVRGR